MLDYTISRVEHGYMIVEGGFFRDGNHGYLTKMWAYSTLEEALKGLNGLYKPPVVVSVTEIKE